MYNWSDLHRELIIDSLYQKRHFLTKKMSISQFHQKLSYQIKKLAPVSTKKFLFDKVSANQVFIGGCYYSDLDQDGKKSIFIEIYFNPDHKTIELTNKSYYQLCVLVADVLIHELIHLRQHRKRNYADIKVFLSNEKSKAKRNNQNYLGHKDEIEAYSFNIACELLDKFNNDDNKAKKFLQGDIQASTQKMTYYNQYLKAFNNDWNHPVMVSLKKQIISNIPKAQIGKPFRNNYWIWY